MFENAHQQKLETLFLFLFEGFLGVRECVNYDYQLEANGTGIV